MNFICLKKDLESKIKYSELFLGKNLEHPVLMGVLLKVSNNLLTISSTNIETEFKAIIPVKKIEDGEVVVSGEVLNKIVSNLKDKEIEFSTNGNILEINQRGSSIKMNILEKDDFPKIEINEDEALESFILDKNTLKESLDSVYFASKEKNMKPELSSILFDFSKPGLMTLAATDGYRLAENKTKIPVLNFDQKIMIPRSFIISLLRIIDSSQAKDVKISTISENQILIDFDSCYIKTRITEGQFPQYEKLIPKEREVSTIILRQDILDTFKMLNIFSDDFDQIYIKIKDSIFEIESKNNFGNNNMKVDAVVDGGDIDMKFNLKYISEAIQNLNSDSFEFIFNNSKPLLIKKVGQKDYSYIVMPLRK